MTGSGMGCPDWPKCFGYWIPPTDVSELPANYKEIYFKRGYDKLNFNAFNTWIEYINRLLGVISGVFCFSLFIISLFVRNKKLFYLSFFLILLMAFQGWMGAIVVYSVLSPFKITIHMLIAIFIVSVLLFLNQITDPKISKQTMQKRRTNKLILFALLISLLQIILGSQVRENVDVLMKNYSKDSIIYQLNYVFELHKITSAFVVLSNIIVVFYYRKLTNLTMEIKGIIIVLCALLFSGVLMTYCSLPGLAQLFHLVFAVSLFGLQWSIFLKQFSHPILKFP